MKRKLNLKIEEVKINNNLQSKGMYGGACGGACGGATGIGPNGSNAVDSGDPTSNGFGGTVAGGSVGPGGGSSLSDQAQGLVDFYNPGQMARIAPSQTGWLGIAESFCAPCHLGFIGPGER